MGEVGRQSFIEEKKMVSACTYGWIPALLREVRLRIRRTPAGRVWLEDDFCMRAKGCTNP